MPFLPLLPKQKKVQTRFQEQGDAADATAAYTNQDPDLKVIGQHSHMLDDPAWPDHCDTDPDWRQS